MTRPTSLDWRNRWGINWITGIRNQNPCGACVAFSTAALIEAMVHIEHALWCVRSEGDVHHGMGTHCEEGTWPNVAIDWIRTNGLADPACFPWENSNPGVPYTPSGDRNGRTVKLVDPSLFGFEHILYNVLLGSIIEFQKNWLYLVGPIIGVFEVWRDFMSYGSGVYTKSATLADGTPNMLRGLHAVLIVGYDDDMNCWIAKNSWGNWGDNGYFRIAYGQCRIDEFAKYGVRHTDPDPWAKRLLHNGNMIESGNGLNQNNFEMVATAGNRIRHWSRNNGASGYPWNQGSIFGNDAAVCPTMTSTTFNRNFEIVYLTTSHRLHHWVLSGNVWYDGGVFGPTDAAGIPGFIQSGYNRPGNFEVVVKTADNRLNHWSRENHAPWTWTDLGKFGNNIAYSGPTLMERFGNLELVCVLTNGKMQHWQRSGTRWQGGDHFGSNIASSPCMIAGEFGRSTENFVGNFELCVAVGGQVQHYSRDNQTTSPVWRLQHTFGHNVRAVAGLLEGSFSFNLEVIVLRTDNQLQHYWRDGDGWHEGVIIGTA